MGNKTSLALIVLMAILLGAAVPISAWLYLEAKTLNKATALIHQENKKLKAKQKANDDDPERTRDTD